MKTPARHFAFFALLGLFLSPLAVAHASPPPADSIPFCHPFDSKQWERDHPRPAAKRLAGLNVGEPRTVRLIYFLPSDRQPQPDIDARMDKLIKDIQLSYAEVMEYHGFGSGTFRFETDATGKAVVHHVRGKFNDEHYHTETFYKVIDEEVGEQFDLSANIYLVALDVSNAVIDGYCGQATSFGPEDGMALIPAPNSDRERERGWSCFSIAVAAHELGHAFGLAHDQFRNATRSPSSYHTDWMVTSFGAAEWLDAHRYFNIGQSYPEEDERTTIQMLLPLAVPPHAVRLRFEVTDSDGLHQAQLHNNNGDAIDFKGISGESASLEFVTPQVTEAPGNEVSLRVVDVYGNVTQEWYQIDTTALPPPEVVSIPDANLAAVVRETLGLPSGSAVRQLDMLKLRGLKASGLVITDLTGLEHAVNLGWLIFEENHIRDLRPLAGLTILETLRLNANSISDISSLAGMTNLTYLSLSTNSISDISPLAGLINLHELELYTNSISDISPLAGLTHLTYLSLSTNSISDISPLVGLTHLTYLELGGNPIADTSPLHELRRRNPNVEIDIDIGEPPPPPHALDKVSGDGQEGLAGVALAEPFVVSVLDEDGAAVAWAVVTFSVTAGGGILSATTATTDANGQASTTLTLILGSDAETNTVEATVEGLEPETFTATAVGQAIPDNLAKVSGEGQEGTAGKALAEPFVVLVLDENGAAIAGAVVTFSVTAGGGTLSAATATTDANGQAATRLTLGSDTGPNTVEATVAGLESETFTATATGLEPSSAGLFDALGGGKRVALPDSPQLAQNAPNPFNSQTVISYILPESGLVHLEVFTLTGQQVAVLHQGPQQAGYYRLHWNGRDDAGRPLASGMYLYRLVTAEEVLTRKLVLLR